MLALKEISLEKIQKEIELIKNQFQREVIMRMVIFGDSLSDSGNMDLRKIFGYFKIPGTGLDKSGDGRFANGLSWPGFFALHWANKLLNEAVDQLAKKYHWNKEKTNKIKKYEWQDFINEIIQPTNKMSIVNDNIIRNFAEGGATAATYKVSKTLLESATTLFETLLKNPEKILEKIKNDIVEPKIFLKLLLADISAVGAQAIVINLAIERHQFFMSQAKLFAKKSNQEINSMKEQTLIPIWVGANDLITVNTTPTKEAADKAIAAIINHMKKLQSAGYNNLILFNLPDLTKTPRYQIMLKNGEISLEEIKRIQGVVEYFNKKIQNEYNELGCKGGVFDVYSKFNEIYDQPLKYGFDPNTINIPLSENSQYHPEKGINPENNLKAMFWNGVHPSSSMQSDICDSLIEFLHQIFKFDGHINAIAEHIEENLRKADKLSQRFNEVCSRLNLNIKMLVSIPKSFSFSIFSQEANEINFEMYMKKIIKIDIKKADAIIDGLEICFKNNLHGIEIINFMQDKLDPEGIKILEGILPTAHKHILEIAFKN